MGESDHNKHRKNDTGDIEKLAAEYSYLDYLVEKAHRAGPSSAEG